MFNTGDIDGFLAYGPPRLVADKVIIDRAGLPAFFDSFTHNAGKPDEKPAWIDRKLRRYKTGDGRVIFGAAVNRSIWHEAWDEDIDFAAISRIEHPAGYSPQFQLWNVYFKDGRIYLLQRWVQMS